jgi:hypothetical protein
LPLQALSSELNIGSSYHPVGSGARAIGMGGAFIGVADDATAASWNPGGLVQLEKSEISFVGAFLNRNDDYSKASQELDPQTIKNNQLNYFSLSYCFSYLQRNMVLSMNYQNLYDLNREFRNLPISITGTGNTNLIEYSVNIYEAVHEGNLSAIGLAYSIEVTPQFSFGITYNFWDDDIAKSSWNTTYISKTKTSANGNDFSTTDIISKYEYEINNGFNANIGFLWHISPAFTLGGVYKTRFTTDLKQKSITHTLTTNHFDNNSMTAHQKIEEKRNDLTMPTSYGLGLAWKISRLFTLSMDIYRTEWDEFIRKTDLGEELSPLISNADLNNDQQADSTPTIKPTYQVRFGSEYLVLNKANQTIIPFRFGLFYDPIPGKGYPDRALGFSLGSGFSKPPYNFDIAFQYRQADDISGAFPDNANLNYDINESILYTSFIYHF